MATPLERVRAEVERRERDYTPAKVPGIYADLRKLIDLVDLLVRNYPGRPDHCDTCRAIYALTTEESS